ncbi:MULTISPECIES: flagellar biosynthesis protein FlhB [Erwinia]|uniref:Flagellar biosynthetic protein FlhB n=1 Tax=Erwinia billingiae (strain Eb661) TaxID=634500 RepID=D8MTA3_ERWBE|nr:MULTISPECIES: flagellar biosynthesis protein FlhB [Erwinia]MBN7120289.1 flagellar biosynthesis protein FlhB [Erwinia billingiae]MCX0500609.1 flagellar type III secretion system protein FlhB [Erwinia billingiae]PRB60210.1 flagellar type III secretion system protein FlhB [Erwinia billingiae]QBR52092.1 flagellar type III secretion system protein FlhB [Erwinia sp. QL-Z3]QEW31848.1 flagellar type III secretion system protein FlhB [Erwinia billingiae]
MAGDSEEEKTESATPHRIEKAREEGQIPRSRELTSVLMLVAGLSILWITGATMARKIGALLADGLKFNHSVVSDTSQMLHLLGNLVQQGIFTLIPMMAGLVLVAIAAPMLLGGVVISGKAIKFDVGKMNPIKGIGKLFSGQTAAELLKSVLKAILVGCVTWLYIRHHWPDMLRLISESPYNALANSLNMIAMCSVLVVFGLSPMVMFDVFWQLYSYFKGLRMTRQDIRDEYKQQEGDPHVKGRIRQQMRAAARRRMMADVPKADVIVTNPTHYSVALQYDERKMSAPKVVAKGAGEIALRIRELGKEHRIPILEAPPLARALYRHSEIGQHIPGTLYAAVAEVLAWVWQLRRWKLEGGLAPKKPDNLTVPEGLDIVIRDED